MVIPNLQDRTMVDFIEKVYQEPWSQFRNNCLHKSLKIVRRAQELGKDADLFICWSVAWQKRFGGFPTIQPHAYTEVEGEVIDVSLDPITEERYHKNSELITFLPLRVPKLFY